MFSFYVLRYAMYIVDLKIASFRSSDRFGASRERETRMFSSFAVPESWFLSYLESVNEDELKIAYLAWRNVL